MLYNVQTMNIILSIPYFVWLIISALFFAGGEFLSKKFALNPGIMLVVLLLISYGISEITWLPAILEKNKLSIVGAMWSVLSLLVTVLLGLLIFNEKISLVGGLGIIFAGVSVVLLSLN
jgi:multidrug transporter EmrE-like cation transporter